MEKIINNNIVITTLDDLELFAKEMAGKIRNGSFIYLKGDLGTGKTAFSKFFLKAKGYSGLVTSPTYSLMLEYELDDCFVIHCDLYRLADPEELYEIGLLDIAYENKAIVLIEWPEKGKKVLPNPDIIITFELSNNKRIVTVNKGNKESN